MIGLLVFCLALPAFIGVHIVVGFIEPLRQLVSASITAALCAFILFYSFRSSKRLQVNPVDWLFLGFLICLSLSWIEQPISFASILPLSLWVNGIIIYFAAKMLLENTDIEAALKLVFLGFTFLDA